MAKKKTKDTVSPEEKLRALYDLQIIDSRIDSIKTIRGELPLEVQDLEDEIQGLETRIAKLQAELDEMTADVNQRKNTIQEAKESIKKYEKQQKNVRNNREFDAITKEMEFQTLEIQLSEKKIKEFGAKVAAKQEIIDEATERLNNRKKDLEGKKSELDEIISETQKEETILSGKSEELSALVDERLLTAYRRIREASKNGLAVVPVERGASGGSFIKIPPQLQMDIAARKKIIVDEHSGRILVDKLLADEETEKMEKTLAKLLK
jgi:uncharacterized protein